MKTLSVSDLLAAGAQTAILNVGDHVGSHEIRGAVRYRPADLLTPEHLAIPLARENVVVIYDNDGDGKHTEEIAAKLEGDGFLDVRVLEGGFKAYEKADGPLQEASVEQVVPPMRASQAGELDHRL